MQNTFKMYEDLKQTFGEESARALTIAISQVYEDLGNMVTKTEFKELHNVVVELAEAQKKTEERLDKLTERVGELVEAQKKTEERLDKLTERVGELAEAQKKTEERLDKLTERVGELAEAQKKTEKTVRTLVIDMNGVKKQLGGLSMAIGYGIEDKYIPMMEKFALNRYGADIKIVERKHIIYPDGTHDEVNLYLEGMLKGEKIYIVGESKAQPGKKDLDKFDLMLRRLKDYLKGNIKGFMIGYSYAPIVKEYAKAKYPDIDLFKTYQIERIADK